MTWKSPATQAASCTLPSVGGTAGGRQDIPGGGRAKSFQILTFDQRSLLLMIFTLSIGHSHSGSVDLQDQERSVASGKREVCPPGLHSSNDVQHLR